jgi:GT2 family glycosyltransferase
MRPLPKVVVIVLNWNAWEVTCDCIESLRHVEYPDFKTVLVDNGSTNDSVQQVANRFPDLPIIRNNANLGYAGGNNVGIRYALQSGAEYVLLLNNDTVVEKTFLAEMVKEAESDTRIGLLSPKIFYSAPPDRIWYAGGEFNLWRGIATHPGMRRHDDAQNSGTRDCTFATGCALLINAKLVRQIGDLDESFFMVCEDTDICIRALRAGFRIVYVGSAVIWHNESYTVRHTSGKWLRDYYNVRNTLLLARKHARFYHWPTLAASLGLTVLYRTAGYLFRGEPDRVAALYRGLRDGLIGKLTQRPILPALEAEV